MSTKIYEKYDNQGRIEAITFWGICQIEKKNGTLKLLLTQYHMELKFQNATHTIFIRSQPDFMRILLAMVEYRLLLFLTMVKVLNFCVSLTF